MAMTPRPRSLSLSCSSVFSAPRSLKEAVNCRFSNFTQTSALTMRDSVWLRRQGVCTTAPAMRVAACSTSLSATGSSAIAAFGFTWPPGFAVVAELAVALAQQFRHAGAVAAEAAHVRFAGFGLERQRLDLRAGAD